MHGARPAKKCPKRLVGIECTLGARGMGKPTWTGPVIKIRRGSRTGGSEGAGALGWKKKNRPTLCRSFALMVRNHKGGGVVSYL